MNCIKFYQKIQIVKKHFALLKFIKKFSWKNFKNL